MNAKSIHDNIFYMSQSELGVESSSLGLKSLMKFNVIHLGQVYVISNDYPTAHFRKFCTVTILLDYYGNTKQMLHRLRFPIHYNIDI